MQFAVSSLKLEKVNATLRMVYVLYMYLLHTILGCHLQCVYLAMCKQTGILYTCVGCLGWPQVQQERCSDDT